MSTLSYAPEVASTHGWLDNLLIRICIRLQLSKSHHEAAENHYLAVCDWLGGPGSRIALLKPNIFPQGSLRIGTTVRPWRYEEYDLDLVLWLALSGYVNPIDILNLVEYRLRDHGTYKEMVERKNRCIRLNFAGEFHMDILPARPDVVRSSDCLLVPDRAAQDWKESNPKGYANWFESRGLLRPIAEKRIATVEPLPEPEEAHEKNTLQLVVQLLKRWRDVRFARTPELAPISIVLTTLAGLHYAGEPHPLEALYLIVAGINRSVPTVGRLKVLNPMNLGEDLSERWDAEPDAYRSFVSAMHELEGDLAELRGVDGFANAKKRLERLFGDTVEGAFRDQVDAVEKARRERQLGVTKTGAIVTGVSSGSVIPVKPNTFYGA